jgi:pimeloyl-ACP methyl ester carboxylesterase
MDQSAPVPAAAVATRLGPLRVETAGSGPPAVLWHSLFVDSASWSRLRTPLAAERRLILIDGPNHGGSPPVRHPFTLDDCAGAAADVLDYLGLGEPVDWLGSAWGGHVGMVFAAAHPGRCRSLITLGTPVHALVPAERRQIRLLVAVYRVAGPGPVVNPLVSALLGPKARDTDPEAVAIVAGAFRRAERRGMRDAVNWISLRRPDLAPLLGRLTCPAMFGTSADDRMWTVGAAARLRDGAAVALPGTGHLGPMLQATPDVASLITVFWRDPEAAVAGHAQDAERTQG